MKILHVIPDLKTASGPTAFCVKVCDRMADAETNVTILHGGQIALDSCVPENPLVRLAQAWPAVSQGARPDLVHIHSLWTPLSHGGARWARRHAIPYIVSAHGMLAPWALKHKGLKKRLAWWLYQRRDLKRAAMFHVTAESEIKWLRDLGFRQPCVLAPLGSDLPEWPSAGTLRRKDVKSVLFVGRLYPVKGLMNLLKAWALLKGAPSVGGHWRCVIAGPDQAGHKDELVAEAERLGLRAEDVEPCRALSRSDRPDSSADILFTGAVYGEEKASLYRMADLFVLPSFTENFGVVVTDALSYGVPVITTKGTPWQELAGSAARPKAPSRGGSSSEACGDVGRCGWWVDIGVKPLAEALAEATRLSDEDRLRMGANGRRLVETSYTWPAIAVKARQAYSWIVNGGAPPECVRLK